MAHVKDGEVQTTLVDLRLKASVSVVGRQFSDQHMKPLCNQFSSAG